MLRDEYCGHCGNENTQHQTWCGRYVAPAWGLSHAENPGLQGGVKGLGGSVREALDATSKLSNPKDIIGSSKLPLHLWPTTATALGCLGLLDGMLKYGRSNFRAVGVRASIYKDACDRHMNAWFEGEDVDPDSGLDHLAHALACIAIIVDARAAGMLNDDRMLVGGYRSTITQLTPHVERLKELHKDKSPRHYTISDNDPLF